jgi:formylglycine-generating enzyme required for sulfatase activity
MKQVHKEAPTLVNREQRPNLLGNLDRQPVLAYVNRPVPFPAARPPAPGTVIENSIGTKLVLIPASEFEMGSPESDTDAESDERPRHRVRLSRYYYLGKNEVTQREWKAVMGTEPWKGRAYVREGADYPAVYISHGDAEEFCRCLSALPAERAAGRVYRLPTEAEWEHGCRGGNKEPTKYHFGGSEDDLGKYAWYDKNADDIGEEYAHPVGQKLGNGYGLYDMHGNVREWCSDRYDSYYYSTSAASGPDPTGPSGGSIRVERGGTWNGGARGSRTAARYGSDPMVRNCSIGFRLALSFV